MALGEDLIAYDWFWGDSLVAAGRIRCRSGKWLVPRHRSATGCTGASDSLLYCSPDASFALGLGLGELPEVWAPVLN